MVSDTMVSDTVVSYRKVNKSFHNRQTSRRIYGISYGETALMTLGNVSIVLQAPLRGASPPTLSGESTDK